MTSKEVRHKPGENGLNFAVFFTNQYEQVVFDETFIRIEIKQGNYTRNGTLDLDEDDLFNTTCDKDIFDFSKFGFTNYDESHIACPKYNDYVISGNFASEAYEYLQINLLECK